jgi:hypothetical protein
VSFPKRVYVVSKPLREAYRLIPCQYPYPNSVCAVEDGTVCCAHSNWGVHGKGGAIKADDSRAASLCFTHHSSLDQGGSMSEEVKKQRWWQAHVTTVRLLVAGGHWPVDIPVPDIEHSPF